MASCRASGLRLFSRLTGLRTLVFDGGEKKFLSLFIKVPVDAYGGYSKSSTGWNFISVGLVNL